MPAWVLVSGRPSEVGAMRLKVNAAAVTVKTVGRPSVGEARLQPRYCSGGNGGEAIGVGSHKR